MNRTSEYKRALNEFIPKDLQKHLPSEISTSLFSLTFNTEPTSNIAGIEPTHVYVEYSTDHIELLVDSLESENFQPFKYKDKCNMVVLKYESYEGKDWLYEKWFNTLDSCNSLNGPIPNFMDIGKGEFKYNMGISSDYDLYLTEAEKGIHFEKSYYTDEHLLPNNWEHGYSKGIALNTKSSNVIHWLYIW